jgi:hypothetical protein
MLVASTRVTPTSKGIRVPSYTGEVAFEMASGGVGGRAVGPPTPGAPMLALGRQNARIFRALCFAPRAGTPREDENSGPGTAGCHVSVAVTGATARG